MHLEELRYIKRRWKENRGDRYDHFGWSWWYFEIDLGCNVLRQIEQYDNGTVLGYHSRKTDDEFGGLSIEPLDNSLDDFEFSSMREFNELWGQRTNP